LGSCGLHHARDYRRAHANRGLDEPSLGRVIPATPSNW
jgi:hypothetical protein